MNAIIIRAVEELESDTAKCEYYVIANVDAPGRARSIVCTKADSAATQAAAILTGLRA